jgi:hypothetical protein
MRTDSEIKNKLVELLGLEGEQRKAQIEALDRNDVHALKAQLIQHH